MQSSAINTAIEQAKDLCQKNNKRMTPLRETVLRLLHQHQAPMTAYQLLAQLRCTHNHAQPVTLYRTLDFLRAAGLVHKAAHSGSYFCCAHPHQHTLCQVLLCAQCGTASECCNDTLAEAINHIATEKRFQPYNSALEIVGICQSCQTL